MRDLFPVKKDDGFERIRKLVKRYFHPVQIGTGLVFSTAGLGMAAAAMLYSDGINFVVENISSLPNYLQNGTDIAGSIEYMKDSYRGSMSNSMEIGWKQMPLSYSVGHYVGGKFKQKITDAFSRGD